MYWSYWNNSRYYGLSLYYGIGGHFKHFMWPQLVLLLLQRTFFIFDVLACGYNMKVNDFLIYERELVICELWSCELWVRLQQLTSCKFIRDSCEFSSIYVLANYLPTRMQARLYDNRNMYHFDLLTIEGNSVFCGPINNEGRWTTKYTAFPRSQ
jgi:hypothetical protein